MNLTRRRTCGVINVKLEKKIRFLGGEHWVNLVMYFVHAFRNGEMFCTDSSLPTVLYISLTILDIMFQVLPTYLSYQVEKKKHMRHYHNLSDFYF